MVRFYLAKKMSSVASMLDRLISTAQKRGNTSPAHNHYYIILLVKILCNSIKLKEKERNRKEREREKETCRFRKINVENEIKYEIYTIFKYIFTYVTIWIFFRLSKD